MRYLGKRGNSYIGKVVNPDNSVSTAAIQDDAVTTAKLGPDAVTSAKVADNAIGNEHLQDDAVNTSEIAASAVTTAKINDDAVTLGKLAAGTAGNLISYDGSGNPVAVATGTAGEVLTSNGAGAAPTFQSVASSNTRDTGLCVFYNHSFGPGDNSQNDPNVAPAFSIPNVSDSYSEILIRLFAISVDAADSSSGDDEQPFDCLIRLSNITASQLEYNIVGTFVNGANMMNASSAFVAAGNKAVSNGDSNISFSSTGNIITITPTNQQADFVSAGFRTGQTITISGTTSNNGTFTINQFNGNRTQFSTVEALTTESNTSAVITGSNLVLPIDTNGKYHFNTTSGPKMVVRLRYATGGALKVALYPNNENYANGVISSGEVAGSLVTNVQIRGGSGSLNTRKRRISGHYLAEYYG